MANRSTHPVETPKHAVTKLSMHAVGDGADELTLPELTQLGGGEIVSSERTGTGEHDLVFRHSYPQLEDVSINVVGATAGLRGRFTAIDVAAKTATLQLEVGATATDAASTDTIYIGLWVRNTLRA